MGNVGNDRRGHPDHRGRGHPASLAFIFRTTISQRADDAAAGIDPAQLRSLGRAIPLDGRRCRRSSGLGLRDDDTRDRDDDRRRRAGPRISRRRQRPDARPRSRFVR